MKNKSKHDVRYYVILVTNYKKEEEEDATLFQGKRQDDINPSYYRMKKAHIERVTSIYQIHVPENHIPRKKFMKRGTTKINIPKKLSHSQVR